jgi:hypothetical protein
MIYTEFDPLQTVIVGDCYVPGDLDNFLPKDSISSFIPNVAQFRNSTGGATVFRHPEAALEFRYIVNPRDV